MRKKTVRRAEPDTHAVAESQPWEVDSANDLPDVPIFTETLLRLELEVQEPAADLGVLSQAVLSDLGATVQIFRMAGQEAGSEQGARPTRIEDCISELGLSACMDAVSAETIGRDHRYNAIAETWAHSREVAHHARLIAEETPDVNPDEAYLVGLLHTIGLLPRILGWYGGQSSQMEGALAGFHLAKRWSLPESTVEYFRGMNAEGHTTPWAEILHKAHRFASRSAIPCPLEREVRPLLYRAV